MIKLFIRSVRKNDLYNNQKGVAAIEFAIAFPVLILLFIGSSVLVEGFRTKRLFEKAAFNLVDLATRVGSFSEETAQQFYTIGRSIIGPAANNPGFIVQLAGAENVFADPNNPTLSLTWSCSSDGIAFIKQADIDAMELPEISRGQGLVIAKVKGSFVPAFELDSIGDINLEEVSVRRPRFLNTMRLDETKNTCKLAHDL